MLCSNTESKTQGFKYFHTKAILTGAVFLEIIPVYVVAVNVG